MKNKKQPGFCAVCGGINENGKTTFTVDYGTGVVVVRNVPAIICSQCGMEWFDAHEVGKIETIVNEAKTKHCEVLVMSLPHND